MFTSAKVRAMCNGTAAATCTDGLVAYATEDGPEYFACGGCRACRPVLSTAGTAVVRDPFAGLPTAGDDEPF